MRTHTYLQYTSEMRTHTCVLRKKCSSTFFQNVINRRSTTRLIRIYNIQARKILLQGPKYYSCLQGPKYYCKGQNIQGPKYYSCLPVPSIKTQYSKWKQSQPRKNEFQMEIAKSYQPPSEIKTLHFCRLVLKFAGSRECYYRGVRQSGNSLCASSKYGVTLMCM